METHAVRLVTMLTVAVLNPTLCAARIWSTVVLKVIRVVKGHATKEWSPTPCSNWSAAQLFLLKTPNLFQKSSVQEKNLSVLPATLAAWLEALGMAAVLNQMQNAVLTRNTVVLKVTPVMASSAQLRTPTTLFIS